MSYTILPSTRWALFLLFLFTGSMLCAQGVKLGIQGIVKRADGSATPDGNYPMTFRLYDAEAGGVALWTEVQSNVSVSSGLYSVVLGSVTDLSLPLDKNYYLGIRIGTSSEMSPRLPLTTAPYALSLRGSTNAFPTSGSAGIGTLSPAAGCQLHIVNASGLCKQTIDGTTESKIEIKKGTSRTASIGFESADNIFRINANGIHEYQHNGVKKLEVTASGVNVNGTGSFSGGITVTGGISTLGAIKIGNSSIDNTGVTSFRRNNTEMMKITADGPVVTGGYIEVSGFKTYNSSFAWYANDGGVACVNKGTSSGNHNCSVTADGRVKASEFNASSDRRIKRDLQLADNLSDLEVLRRLKVRDYRYVDVVRRGNALRKGFIAQEVKAVFPEAVSTSTEYVPEVYEKATGISQYGDRIVITMQKEHGLQQGDDVRLELSTGSRFSSVAEIVNANTFVLANWKEELPEWIFVYGKKVDDLHQVDYDRIHTLNVSATQELIRQVESAESDTRALKRETGAARSKIDQLEIRLRNLEAGISN